MKIKVLCIICLCLFTVGTMKVQTQEFFRAQIGIQIRSSDGTERWSEVRYEKVTVDDQYRIYIIPQFDAYVYVVYANENIAKLLHEPIQAKIFEDTLPVVVLPSEESWYQFSGERKSEDITIVCSPEKLSKLEELFEAQEISYKKWLAYETDLIDKSSIDLSAPVPKLLNIAGTARELANQLKITSSRLYVTKLYKFRVKK